jgi:hypothetical protein
MNTQNTKTLSFVYPVQPVHPELVERLYTEVDRLACRAARQSYLPLPQDLDSRMVAATLRYLDQQGVCLSPRTPEARAELQKRALYTLHYRWNKTTLRDYKRASQKAFIESLETKEGDAWEPVSDLYGNSCEDATPFPGEDLLAGETGRLVLAILKREFELTEERALTVLFMGTLGKFPLVEEAFREMGRPVSAPAYLRKWAGREAPQILARLREILQERGIEGYQLSSISENICASLR